MLSARGLGEDLTTLGLCSTVHLMSHTCTKMSLESSEEDLCCGLTTKLNVTTLQKNIWTSLMHFGAGLAQMFNLSVKSQTWVSHTEIGD